MYSILRFGGRCPWRLYFLYFVVLLYYLRNQRGESSPSNPLEIEARHMHKLDALESGRIDL